MLNKRLGDQRRRAEYNQQIRAQQQAQWQAQQRAQYDNQWRAQRNAGYGQRWNRSVPGANLGPDAQGRRGVERYINDTRN
mgnify:CR=1 FL=1